MTFPSILCTSVPLGIDLATIGQIVFVIVFYIGFLAWMIEAWWKTKTVHERPDPVGDLEDE